MSWVMKVGTGGQAEMLHASYLVAGAKPHVPAGQAELRANESRRRVRETLEKMLHSCTQAADAAAAATFNINAALP